MHALLGSWFRMLRSPRVHFNRFQIGYGPNGNRATPASRVEFPARIAHIPVSSLRRPLAILNGKMGPTDNAIIRMQRWHARPAPFGYQLPPGALLFKCSMAHEVNPGYEICDLATAIPAAQHEVNSESTTPFCAMRMCAQRMYITISEEI